MAKEKKTTNDTSITSESIFQLIQQAGRPLTLDELLKISGASRKLKKTIVASLNHFEESGILFKTQGKWFFPKKYKEVCGTFSLQRSGAGFVIPANGGNDIFIPTAHMNDAWDGDIVKVMILPGRKGPSKEGRVMEIIESANKIISVHAMKEQKDGIWMCVPLNQGIQHLFLVNPKETTIQLHDLLLIRPTEKKDNHIWHAELKSNLHNEKSPLAQELLAKAHNSIPSSFPSLVLSETSAMPEDPLEKEFSGRKDLRDIPFVTIDGADAKDFDDAIFVEKLAKGFRLFVAIADVAHYVRLGSALDKEALVRGNSYYFPLSVEPMLPHALSNTLCSLKPHVPRLVMVAEMVFDESGKETSSHFYQGVIRSKARLTYDQVFEQAIQKTHNPDEIILPVLPMLERAMRLATILSERREQQGSLDFDLSETSFRFDKQGNVSDVLPRVQHFAHKLIEVFMVAANESVARFLTKKQTPLLYRIHPAPSQEKLELLTRYLTQTGLYSFPTSDSKKHSSFTPRELNAILQTAKNTPQEYVINRLVLRTMMQAKYAPDNEGHYGLGSECYGHFTSPIRRYADLTVHRALKATLGVDNQEVATAGQLQKIADHINQTERSAMEAERETAKRLTILFLQDRVGEEFDGIISGVTDFGIFVEVPSCMAEGMIRLGALKDDYYDFIPERHLLRGRDHNNTYALGDKVRVKLIDTVLDRKEINFIFVDSEPTPRRSLKVTFIDKKSKKAPKKQIQTKEQAKKKPKAKSSSKSKARKKSLTKKKS